MYRTLYRLALPGGRRVLVVYQPARSDPEGADQNGPHRLPYHGPVRDRVLTQNGQLLPVLTGLPSGATARGRRTK